MIKHCNLVLAFYCCAWKQHVLEKACVKIMYLFCLSDLLAWEFWKKSKKELAALSVYENVFFLKIGHNKVMEIIYSL